MERSRPDRLDSERFRSTPRTYGRFPALVWAAMHVFPGVLMGWAIAFGAHSPALSLAALGVLILGWMAWSMIASIADCSTAPESGTRNVRSAAEGEGTAVSA
jgi:hypothetical protein